jgi:predicted small integral membrane protein
MEGTARTVQVIRLGSNLSLLAAVFACLALWGGISLLLTHSSHSRAFENSTDGPVLPQPVARWKGGSEARRALANMLLFWLPLGLGAVACSTGVVTLACSRERDPDASRRALIALTLSAVPGCLCTLWYIAFSAPSF